MILTLSISDCLLQFWCVFRLSTNLGTLAAEGDPTVLPAAAYNFSGIGFLLPLIEERKLYEMRNLKVTDLFICWSHFIWIVCLQFKGGMLTDM